MFFSSTVSLFAFLRSSSSTDCGCEPSYPVCASNFQTYDGVCAMQCHMKYQSGELYVLHEGECGMYTKDISNLFMEYT